MEDIPSYDDKIRDEDAKYYENLDLDSMKTEENSASQTEAEKINEINLDEYENLDDIVESTSIVDETQNLDEFINNSQSVDLQVEEPKLVESPQEQFIENEIQAQAETSHEPVVEDAQQVQNVETSDELLKEDIQIYDENIKAEEVQPEIPQQDEKIIEDSLEKVDKVEKEIENEVKPFEFEHLDEDFDISDDISGEIDIKSKLDKLTPIEDNNIIGENDVQ